MSEKHKKLYKPGLNIEDVRKERDRKHTQVRKEKIHYNVQKRRNIQEDDKYSIDFDVTEHVSRFNSLKKISTNSILEFIRVGRKFILRFS